MLQFHTFLFLGLAFIFSACEPDNQQTIDSAPITQPDTTIFTKYSNLPNQYQNFHSPKAIDQIAKIENHYFRNYDQGITPYYGTIWREQNEIQYQRFTEDLGEKGDSMHCTIYAVEALKAGLGANFEAMEASHRRIWKSREHAGWSIGYILVKEWNWKAYLIMDRNSKEFDHCQRAFQRSKSYPVWKQPDIPLERILIRGEEDSTIQKLLLENEFGWGFSHQGIHTWITRFDQLKECNWLGAPGKKYETYSKPLFLKTPFLEFHDYASHVVIFPPKVNDSQ